MDEDQALAAAFANLAAIAATQAGLTRELRGSLAKLAHQNDVLRPASLVEDRLAALALDGADLHEIAFCVAS